MTNYTDALHRIASDILSGDVLRFWGWNLSHRLLDRAQLGVISIESRRILPRSDTLNCLGSTSTSYIASDSNRRYSKNNQPCGISMSQIRAINRE